MWPNYSAVKDPGYAPASKQQNHPTLFLPPRHFADRRPETISSINALHQLPLFLLTRVRERWGRSLQLMENPEGLQKHADGTIGQLNGKIAELDQSRAGLNRSNRERLPMEADPASDNCVTPCKRWGGQHRDCSKLTTKSGRTPTAPTWR